MKYKKQSLRKREDPSLINIIAWLHRDITRRCPTVFEVYSTYKYMSVYACHTAHGVVRLKRGY